MDGDDRTFKANFSTEGVSRLRDVVKEKLKEFMGDYTDDTLVDYVIVLIQNGRRKEEAKTELDVFLGSDTVPFISWLWDHLGSNLSLYVKTQVHTDIAPSRKPNTHEQGRSDVDDKQRSTQSGQSQENTFPEKNFNETIVIHRSKNTSPDKKRHHLDSNREAPRRTKESLSHRAKHDRERGQSEEKQRRKRDSLSSESAPRRLLQFAVRDAVAMSKPSLKRLRSVVTRTTEESEEEHPKRTRQISMSAAIKAVAEAANDVCKVRRSHNVFDRIGHGGNFPNAASGQDFGVVAGGVADQDTEMVDNSRGHIHNVLSVQDPSENYQQNNFDYDTRQLEAMGMPQLGSFGRKRVENSQIYPEGLTAGYARKISSLSMSHRRDMSEMQTQKHHSESQSTGHEMMPKKTSNPIVPFNGNVKVGPSPQVSQKQQSNTGSHHNGIPSEDADSRTIFVNNVHFGASKDALSKHFIKFGDILKVIILTDPSTGQPKGSAYIEFMKKDAAELALSLNGTLFMTRILRIVRKTAAQAEATSVLSRPPLTRPSPFSAFSRSLSRGTHSIYRARIPGKPGSRSFQWKREPDANATESAAQATSSGKFPPTRSFTYVRTEQNTDGNSGNA